MSQRAPSLPLGSCVGPSAACFHPPLLAFIFDCRILIYKPIEPTNWLSQQMIAVQYANWSYPGSQCEAQGENFWAESPPGVVLGHTSYEYGENTF